MYHIPKAKNYAAAQRIAHSGRYKKYDRLSGKTHRRITA